MRWNAAIDGWSTWARAGDASDQTMRLRLHYLHRLADLYRDQDPLMLTTDHLAAFLARPGWAPETRKSARASVRALYRWAHATGRIPADPSWPLPAVRVPPGKPRPIPVSLFADAVEHAEGVVGDDDQRAFRRQRRQLRGVEAEVERQGRDGGVEKALVAPALALALIIELFQLLATRRHLDRAGLFLTAGADGRDACRHAASRAIQRGDLAR